MASLKFNIDGQIITRTDSLKVVADSIDYLYAEFIFPSEWSGTKTAIFTMGRKTWSLLIKDGSCKVPWEVLKKSTSFTVSVVCGNRITSNVVTVPVIPSGYKEGDTPKEPTPDVYSQILGQLDTIKDVADTADRNASDALNAANNIGAGVNEAKWLADMANSKSSEALNIAQNIPDEYYSKDDIDNMGFASEEVIYDYSYSKEESDETYNGLNAHISAVERTVDDLDSKLSTVYKYEMSTTWHLIQFGLIEGNSGYPFEVGMVFNIEEDDEMPSAYSHTGEAVSIKAGDNIAIAVIDNGIPKFDKLSATIDLSNYATKDEVSELTTKTIILSNIMTTDEIATAINTAPKGTVFDIQTSLDLYDVNVSFPERSVVYSSTANRKNISFGYSDTSDPEVWNQNWYLSFGAFSKISDLDIFFSDNATSNVGVTFGERCEVANCSFSGYSPFDWRDNCTFTNCVLSYYVYSLSNGGSYIGCNFDYTDIYGGIDLRNVYLSDCSCESFKVNNDTLAIAAKIKSLNPGMKLVDSEDNEIKGLYATADDVSSMINSAVGLAMEGEY